MSEVKRFDIEGSEWELIEGRDWVASENFDRVTAERDAALGREAALLLQCGGMQMAIDELQQRLNAADERVDVLEGLLREAESDGVSGSLILRIRAALKPAEVSGSTCNQIREETGLPINRPCKACNGGSCIDR